MNAQDLLESRTFLCRICGQKRGYFYDWQRCYDCMMAGAVRDYQSVPAICRECCLRYHRPNLDPKQR